MGKQGRMEAGPQEDRAAQEEGPMRRQGCKETRPREKQDWWKSKTD